MNSWTRSDISRRPDRRSFSADEIQTIVQRYEEEPLRRAIIEGKPGSDVFRSFLFDIQAQLGGGEIVIFKDLYYAICGEMPERTSISWRDWLYRADIAARLFPLYDQNTRSLDILRVRDCLSAGFKIVSEQGFIDYGIKHGVKILEKYLSRWMGADSLIRLYSLLQNKDQVMEDGSQALSFNHWRYIAQQIFAQTARASTPMVAHRIDDQWIAKRAFTPDVLMGTAPVTALSASIRERVKIAISQELPRNEIHRQMLTELDRVITVLTASVHGQQKLDQIENNKRTVTLALAHIRRREERRLWRLLATIQTKEDATVARTEMLAALENISKSHQDDIRAYKATIDQLNTQIAQLSRPSVASSLLWDAPIMVQHFGALSLSIHGVGSWSGVHALIPTWWPEGTVHKDAHSAALANASWEQELRAAQEMVAIQRNALAEQQQQLVILRQDLLAQANELARREHELNLAQGKLGKPQYVHAGMPVFEPTRPERDIWPDAYEPPELEESTYWLKSAQDRFSEQGKKDVLVALQKYRKNFESNDHGKEQFLRFNSLISRRKQRPLPKDGVSISVVQILSILYPTLSPTEDFVKGKEKMIKLILADLMWPGTDWQTFINKNIPASSRRADSGDMSWRQALGAFDRWRETNSK